MALALAGPACDFPVDGMEPSSGGTVAPSALESTSGQEGTSWPVDIVLNDAMEVDTAGATPPGPDGNWTRISNSGCQDGSAADCNDEALATHLFYAYKLPYGSTSDEAWLPPDEVPAEWRVEMQTKAAYAAGPTRSPSRWNMVLYKDPFGSGTYILPGVPELGTRYAINLDTDHIRDPGNGGLLLTPLFIHPRQADPDTTTPFKLADIYPPHDPTVYGASGSPNYIPPHVHWRLEFSRPACNIVGALNDGGTTTYPAEHFFAAPSAVHEDFLQMPPGIVGSFDVYSNDGLHSSVGEGTGPELKASPTSSCRTDVSPWLACNSAFHVSLYDPSYYPGTLANNCPTGTEQASYFLRFSTSRLSVATGGGPSITVAQGASSFNVTLEYESGVASSLASYKAVYRLFDEDRAPVSGGCDHTENPAVDTPVAITAQSGMAYLGVWLFPVAATPTCSSLTLETATDSPLTVSDLTLEADVVAIDQCGDGRVTGTEECDDGNLLIGDGCLPTCQHEFVVTSSSNVYGLDFGQAGEDAITSPAGISDIKLAGYTYDGRLFVLTSAPAPQLYEIDPTDGDIISGPTALYSSPADPALVHITDWTQDPSDDGKFYVNVRSPEGGAACYAARLDLTTGQVAKLANPHDNCGIRTLATHPSGRLYGLDVEDAELLEIHTSGSFSGMALGRTSTWSTSYGEPSIQPDDRLAFSADGSAWLFEAGTKRLWKSDSIDDGEAWQVVGEFFGPGLRPSFGLRKITTCGNGTTQDGEACDDGNNVVGTSDTCSGDCFQDVSCGNGTWEAGEQCDDGNAASGDGCSSCAFETCDGTAAPDTPRCATDADCSSYSACTTGVADCDEIKCTGDRFLGQGVEQITCAEDATEGDGEPCESVSTECDAANCATNNGSPEINNGIGSYVVKYGLVSYTSYNVGAGLRINYVFNTASADGTPFNIWMRNAYDLDFNTSYFEEYYCSVTGVSTDSGVYYFKYSKSGVEGGRHGPDCDAITSASAGRFCWLAADGDSDSTTYDPVVLNHGEHKLQCEIESNYSTNRRVGYDGIIVTSDTEYVPDAFTGSSPTCSNADFTGGLCSYNWTRRPQTFTNLGYCSKESPKPQVCGDGNVCGTEACDDGDTLRGGGCDWDCQTATCGNGVTDSGESCDAGSFNGDCSQCNDACTGTVANVCGNSLVECNEECDDGNTSNGDGCGSTCLFENCAGAAGAPECVETADCLAYLACTPSGSCSERDCMGADVEPGPEFQICSNADKSGGGEGITACVDATCTDDNLDQSGAFGTDCARSSYLSTFSIDYTFRTSNPDGTDYYVWVRNIADDWGGTASSAVYNCTVTNTAPAGNPVSLAISKNKLTSGDLGEECRNFSDRQRYCWMAFDGDTGTSGHQPVPLLRGSHSLSCTIANNGIGSSDPVGSDGLIFTTDAHYVPDQGYPNLNGACSTDAAFESGICWGNWGPNGFGGTVTPGLCTGQSLVQVCGDGYPCGTETCDDGNTTPGDDCSATCQDEDCGNGIIDPVEACDDGNIANCDGCKGDCTRADDVCGDGITDSGCGESCDDGDTAACAGSCNETCTATYSFTCGDGDLECGEECDDGNTSNGDGCDSSCQDELTATAFPFVEDWESGTIKAYWQVDAENTVEVVSDPGPSTGDYHLSLRNEVISSLNLTYTNSIVLSINLAGQSSLILQLDHRCRIDVTNPEEGVFVSTNGGTNWTKADNLTCAASTSDYVRIRIDLSSLSGFTPANPTLIRFTERGTTEFPAVPARFIDNVRIYSGSLSSSCGNGWVDAGEACDDGDTINNGEGGCLASCSGIQTCGDGTANGTESCDDGNIAVCPDCGGSCTGTCNFDCTGVLVAASCGNGTIECGEDCDDSNTSTGDGCDASCKVEAGCNGLSDVASSPFVDISNLTSATTLSFNNTTSVTMPSGFNFNYWLDSGALSSIRTYPEGFIVAGTENVSNVSENMLIPSISPPDRVAAAFWDDINYDGASKIQSATLGSSPNRRFIIQWTDWFLRHAPLNRLTFQVVFHEEADIMEYRYKKLTNQGGSASVGLESDNDTTNGIRGTQHIHNEPHSLLAGQSLAINFDACVAHDGVLNITEDCDDGDTNDSDECPNSGLLTQFLNSVTLGAFEFDPGSSTSVTFDLSRSADVTLKVWPDDLKQTQSYGTPVYASSPQSLGSGTHTLYWDGKTTGGAYLPENAYLLVLEADLGAGTVIRFPTSDHNPGPTSGAIYNSGDPDLPREQFAAFNNKPVEVYPRPYVDHTYITDKEHHTNGQTYISRGQRGILDLRYPLSGSNGNDAIQSVYCSDPASYSPDILHLSCAVSHPVAFDVAAVDSNQGFDPLIWTGYDGNSSPPRVIQSLVGYYTFAKLLRFNAVVPRTEPKILGPLFGQSRPALAPPPFAMPQSNPYQLAWLNGEPVSIHFEIDRDSDVTLTLDGPYETETAGDPLECDGCGTTVVFSGSLSAGAHQVVWDGNCAYSTEDVFATPSGCSSASVMELPREGAYRFLLEAEDPDTSQSRSVSGLVRLMKE